MHKSRIGRNHELNTTTALAGDGLQHSIIDMEGTPMRQLQGQQLTLLQKETTGTSQYLLLTMDSI